MSSIIEINNLNHTFKIEEKKIIFLTLIRNNKEVNKILQTDKSARKSKFWIKLNIELSCTRKSIHPQ